MYFLLLFIARDTLRRYLIANSNRKVPSIWQPPASTAALRSGTSTQWQLWVAKASKVFTHVTSLMLTTRVLSSGKHVARQRRRHLLPVLGTCRPQLRHSSNCSQWSVHLGPRQGQGHSALSRARRTSRLLRRLEPEGLTIHCFVWWRRKLVGIASTLALLCSLLLFLSERVLFLRL